MVKRQRIDSGKLNRAAQARGIPSRRSGSPAKRAAAKRSGRPGAVRPATLGTWIAGARPLTLLLAIAPVAIGTGAASLDASMPSWSHHWVRALACLALIALLQIGVNYANDYSDGIRGTDRDRVGPVRLVGSGRAAPRRVLKVAIVFFGLAALVGAFLVWRTGAWWLIAAGVVCLAAAWFYTGGRRPYGYTPLGEVVVVLFFGVVPALGTMYVQTGTVNWEAGLGGVAVGALAAVVLLANNVRDRERDAAVGKRTLAVVAGLTGSRVILVILLLIPLGILAFWVLFYPLAGYVFFVAFVIAPTILIVVTARTAREFLTVLRLAILASLGYGLGLGAAFAFWA